MKHLRIGLVFATTVILTACGFKPMHAPTAFGGTGVSLSNTQVQMQANNKIDFLLAQALRNRMGDNQGAQYILQITPETKRNRLGIGADDVASRYDLVMTTDFALVEAKTGDIVYRSSVRAISTFGAPRDPYGTSAAQSNAEQQVSSEVADRIIARLAGYQSSQDKKAKAEKTAKAK